MRTGKKHKGFTVIELAVVLAVLSIVLLAAGVLLLNTTDTYAKITSTTMTMMEARECLQSISREVREAMGDPNIADLTVPVNDLAPVTNDAMLLTSARDSNGIFSLTLNNFPNAESIILYYLNTTAEGDTQLMRLQLYYVDDFNIGAGSIFVPPFSLASPAYAGNNIVIQDVNNIPIAIDRATGAIGGAGGIAPTRPPRVLMNQTFSFDIMNDFVNPIEIRVSCQIIDRFNREATTRLVAEIEPRN